MNLVKQKLGIGRHTVGTWMQIPNPIIAEILAANGFDWIAVDLEHGSYSLSQLPDIFRAISLHNSLPMARVAQNHPKDIKQALDAGARGVIVPMIESKQAVVDFVKWSSYPPEGTRGVGYSQANLYGNSFSKYINEINTDLVRVIQIENINALREIDEIFSVPGIDAAMIGPYDLSGSMNLTGKFDHPEFLEVVRKFQEAAAKSKLPLGTHLISPDPEKLDMEIQSGKKFIAYSTDAVMLNEKSKLNLKGISL
ncbi:2,4-dihydroxyhept-2-ene-1,7-dioic acid aldolase [Leptospira levettii]|uniref:HpcH/HpaI aldolase family protein n=1 Tax=Leptospira levettii TaxID=2023178 RepID=UPI001083C83F|nr:aldolase/citrate lyase family protein [Leptospira levettii]TGM94162.1 2,4-dihydroxyhept-2-ene-1,7-dioic acid aldolase [Leptospira levettii]